MKNTTRMLLSVSLDEDVSSLNLYLGDQYGVESSLSQVSTTPAHNIPCTPPEYRLYSAEVEGCDVETLVSYCRSLPWQRRGSVLLFVKGPDSPHFRAHSMYQDPEEDVQDLKARIRELEDLSVTNILLRVVPGDGSGSEIYAKSVREVVDFMTDMGVRLEEYEQGLRISPVVQDRLAELEACFKQHQEMLVSIDAKLGQYTTDMDVGSRPRSVDDTGELKVSSLDKQPSVGGSTLDEQTLMAPPLPRTSCTPSPTKEFIAGVAFLMGNGDLFSLPRPSRHHDLIRHLSAEFGLSCDGSETQGFITNKGAFLDRAKAYELAVATNTLRRDPNPRFYQGSELYSEDLW